MNNKKLTNLGERLKQAREALGKSQKEMAMLINVSFRALQGYEAGENEPGSKVIIALTKIGFNANWLLTGEGEMRNRSLPLEIKDAGVKSFTISTSVVMEYQESLKEKISPEKQGRLIYTLWKILSVQNLKWQTEEKAKVILTALIKLSEDFKLFRKLNMEGESILALLGFLDNPDFINLDMLNSDDTEGNKKR